MIDASLGWILGWTLVHSLWQGAVVAAGLALVLRFVPGAYARLRAAVSWGALLLVIGLAAGTWVLVDMEWKGHVACWESEAFVREHPGLCFSHAVPAARLLLDEHGKHDVAGPLEWTRRLAIPVPGSVRHLSIDLTGGVGWLAGIWGLLAVGAALRLGFGLRLLRGVLERASPLSRDDVDGVVRRVHGDLRVGPPVEIRESEEISTPAVAGWRRPIILMPRGMADALEPEQLTDVFAHELIHVRGRHFAVNLGQRALDCLCLLNPFALWISSRIREEREAHCDSLAAGPPAGARRRRYAETLLELEQLRGPANPALVGLVGEGKLLRRIRRLADSAGDRRAGQTRRAVLAGGAALAMVTAVAWFSMTMVALTSWAVMSHDIDLREAAGDPATRAPVVEPAPTSIIDADFTR